MFSFSTSGVNLQASLFKKDEHSLVGEINRWECLQQNISNYELIALLINDNTPLPLPPSVFDPGT